MAEDNGNDVRDYIREVMREEKARETAVGKVMKNGGGAVTGSVIGWTAGGLAAVALAPLTGGLSILVPPLAAVAGGVMGHKMSKDID